MIKYFRVKEEKNKNYTSIIYREKNHTRENNAKKEVYIQKKKPVLITGDGDSKKSYYLEKVYKKERQIWKKRGKALFFSAFSPISYWFEQEPIKIFVGEDKYKKLSPATREKKLIEYCTEQKPVIFIDDLQKLTGRKLQIAKKCINATSNFWATSTSENKIPISIRQSILRTKPQIFSLHSRASYDMTTPLVWGFVVIMFFIGMPEVGLLAGGAKMLSGGRKSSN